MWMQKLPSSSPVAAITRLPPSPPMVSGLPSTLCEITIRLIYLSCARTDRMCGRLPQIPTQTGNRNGNRRQQLLCDYDGGRSSWFIHGRGVMKKFLSFFLLVSILSGCSGLPVSIPFLQTTAPDVAASPKPTATPFSLQPTNTPNLFVINTAEPSTTPAEGTTQLPATNTPPPTYTA